MTLPFRRRPDVPARSHERAQALAAERLDGPLGEAEGRWLDDHLADCAGCRAAEEAYERDQLELRSLRRQPIDPPRDLWARTAAAIEREAGASVPRRRTSSVMPLGAISGLLVVAVVFGAAILSSRPQPTLQPVGTPPAVAFSFAPRSTGSPVPTPLAVPEGNVDYLAVAADGSLAIHSAQYSEVCPNNGAKCRPLPDVEPLHIDVPNAPQEAIMAPTEDQIVVTLDSGVFVVPAPTPFGGVGGPTGPPDPTPSLAPSTTSAPTPTAEPTPTREPTPTPAATPTDEPTQPPSSEPTTEPTVEPSVVPGLTPIAEDVLVVGEAEFDAAGQRFAFSARPADGSTGPDIYVWTVGDAAATPLTSDHRSIFSGWHDDLVLGSRPADPTAAETVGQAFVLDPATGTESVVDAPPAWRPAVDPTGRWAVYWAGTIVLDESGTAWQPAEGRIVVGPWPGSPSPLVDGETDGGGGSPEPTSPLPTDGASPFEAELQPLFAGVVRDWEARWDETGTHVALWVADADDPTIGRLSLFASSDRAGRLQASEPELRGQVARPGFSIGSGHLAWATKDGQDGKASHVRIVAWTADGIGQIETASGEDVLVVQR